GRRTRGVTRPRARGGSRAPPSGPAPPIHRACSSPARGCEASPLTSRLPSRLSRAPPSPRPLGLPSVSQQVTREVCPARRVWIVLELLQAPVDLGGGFVEPAREAGRLERRGDLLHLADPAPGLRGRGAQALGTL